MLEELVLFLVVTVFVAGITGFILDMQRIGMLEIWKKKALTVVVCIHRNKLTILYMLLLATLLTVLFSKYSHENPDKLLDHLNTTTQFTGIFCALLITFLIHKVMQLRRERLESHKEVIMYSNKVTDFRRIASILKNSRRFWDREMIRKMDSGTYKSITFFDLHLGHNFDHSKEKSEALDKFHKDQNLPGAYLYLDLKSLVGKEDLKLNSTLYGKYDWNFTYKYKILEWWSGAVSGNNLYYCFSHKWHSYQNIFDLDNILDKKKEDILYLCKKINKEKYSSKLFSHELLSDIGGDFTEYILPKLTELTYKNTRGLPRSIYFILGFLFITIISGILTPLMLTSMDISDQLRLWASNIATTILIMTLIYFLFHFKSILESEIKVS